MPPEASLPHALVLSRIASPIGDILLVTDETGALRALDFHDFEPRMRRLLRRQYGELNTRDGAAPAVVYEALGRYFAGELMALEGLAWSTNGTKFQRRVWASLPDIPPGKTLTYKGLAAQIGRPAAVRAVGLANGSNPIALVLPCHRVIGADGSLTGYGGGLPRKSWLLLHEGAHFRDAVFAG